MFVRLCTYIHGVKRSFLLFQEYNVTTRQEQLAQLTPSQLIELAYLCALLEQHPYSKSEPISHKLEVIRSFLDAVVHVVPLESIFFAIANGSNDTALSCSKALMDSQLVLPGSDILSDGLYAAMIRMRYGIQGFDANRLIDKSLEQASDLSIHRQYSTSVQINSKEVSMSVLPRLPGQFVPYTLQPFGVTTVKREELEFINPPAGSDTISKYLTMLQTEMVMEGDKQCGISKLICGLDIDVLYPISHGKEHQETSSLKSPLAILSNGRKKLSTFLSKAKPSQKLGVRTMLKYNQRMLETVNQIRKKEVATCTTLLGAFMQQEEIVIVLGHSRRDISPAFGISATASVGIWALFSLDYAHVQPILAKCKGNQLLVKIEDYIKAQLSGDIPEDSRYAAKLQFIVQGMKKTVTCNSQYISYSLERQLKELCRMRKIQSSIPVDTLLKKWGGFFKENILSLVEERSRPLIARWLKWALMIHNLREELAKYTAIGVVGLVNSGKSKLVNTLFDIQVVSFKEN